MRSFVRAALMLAAAVAPAMAQAKPVVAILYYDNNSFGKDRADYDGLGKGIADLLITDMARNPSVRLVERERIQALLVEQNMTRQGAVDPQTAIRLGKILGAQYMIYGGFMSDSKGKLVLTSRAVNVETSAIISPVKIERSGDDVLGLIAEMSTKLNNEMKLPALQVGQGGGAMGGATPAGQPAAQAAPAAAQAVATAGEPKTESKPAKAEARPAKAETRVARAESKPGKMDLKTAMLYSKALEEEDAGNRTRAVELYKQVVAKFPLPAAQEKIQKLSRS